MMISWFNAKKMINRKAMKKLMKIWRKTRKAPDRPGGGIVLLGQKEQIHPKEKRKIIKFSPVF